MNEKIYNELTHEIIGACIEVHKELGPGLLESVYEECLMIELEMQGLKAVNQVILPVLYKGRPIKKSFVMDVIVEDLIVLELKALEEIHPIHEVTLMTYLRLSQKKLGLLVNFNVPVLKSGLRRKINGNLNE